MSIQAECLERVARVGDVRGLCLEGVVAAARHATTWRRWKVPPRARSRERVRGAPVPAAAMREDLQALLDRLHEAERRAEDEQTQPALLLLLDLLLQLRPSLEDLSAVPVGVLVSRLGKKSSRVSEAVRERAVRCKRAWQALLQGGPSPAACAATTAAAAPPAAEESGGRSPEP